MSTIPAWHDAAADTTRRRSRTDRIGVPNGPDDLVAVVDRAHEKVHPTTRPDVGPGKVRRRGEEGADGGVAASGTAPFGVGAVSDRGTAGSSGSAWRAS
jgi:hypothetical protein